MLALVVVSLLVPPFRHWFERHIKSIHEKLDHQHEEHLTLMAHHHKEAMALARKHHAEHMVALGSTKNARDAKGRFIKS